MEIAELRKGIYANDSGGFSDIQLLEQSASVVQTFRELNLGGEDRPAKRRKTLPESEETTDTSTYERMIMVLNGSTQESPVLDLTDLHNIVQYVFRVCHSNECLQP